ncbi:MAG: PIN domain-containing protein [Thiohalocapsa sp.]
MFDATIIMGAHLAEGEERDACLGVLALAKQKRIRAHICGNSLGQIAEELARGEGRDSAKEWMANARQFLNVVPTSNEILDAALSNALNGDRVYFEDAITLHTARVEKMELIVTLNDGDFSAATTPVAQPQHLLEQFHPQVGVA